MRTDAQRRCSTAAPGDWVEPLHARKPGEVGIGGVNDRTVSNPQRRDRRVRRQTAARTGALDERKRLIQVRAVRIDDGRYGPTQPAPDFRRRFGRGEWRRAVSAWKDSTSRAAARSCSRAGSMPARRRIGLVVGLNRGSTSAAYFLRPRRIASLRATLKVSLRSRIALRKRRSVLVSRVTVVLT